ncbi:NlpC/P60 family protein [Lactiplantibacillus daoliensis]|uniref:NlpC/P60 family protein n=1 Tax=Lactiplantibacillus daoliensis TaxID=2559916 RepID=A0ABW1UJ86_9LACO|nr:C40 family peptidase [Lactiplantibacillus daoliensis]
MKKVNIKQVMLGTAALAGLMVTSQAVANADSMTIKSGDTVWAYSQKYHVSIDQIVKENKLGSADFIVAGQKINIPGVKTSDSSKTATASASSVKSTSAATSTSSQATSAVATSSSVTSASSTSEAASSSVVSSSAAVQSSTSTASVSSSVASSAAATSQSSSVVSQASQSSVSSSASTSQASTTQASTTQASTSQSQNTTPTTYRRSARVATTTQSQATNTNVSSSSAISAAYTLVGTPYEVLDCSAFTQAAFAKAGRQIGRTTYAQATLGAHVSFGQAQAGDLVFWGSDSAPYHVAIYLGGGQYIGAHDYGDPASVKSTAYYTPSFAIHM